MMQTHSGGAVPHAGLAGITINRTDRNAGFGPRALTLRLCLAIMAMLAVTWQSVVVQSHVHLNYDVAARSGDLQHHAEARLTRDHAPADTPADCPICRQLAHAGHYLSPATLNLVASPAIVAWLPGGLLPLWIARQSSHAWRSRGPPTLLQSL